MIPEVMGYGFILIVCMLISALFFVSSFKDKSFGYKLLSIFCFLAMLIFLGESSQVFLQGIGKLFGFAIANIGYSFISYVCLLFALYFTNRNKYLKPKFLILLAIIPMFSVIIGFISCYYPILGIFTILPSGAIQYEYSIIYWCIDAYLIILSVVSIIFFFIQLFKDKENKMQFILLIIAILTPICVELLSIVNTSTSIDFIALSYFIAVILVQWAVLGFDLLDSSVIHKEFIDYVNVGMMFFNKDNKLEEFNYLSRHVLGLTDKDINKSIDEIFDNYPKFLDFFNDNNIFAEFKIPNLHHGDLVYILDNDSRLVHNSVYVVDLEEVSISAYKRLFFKGDTLQGTLITFYDITAYKHATYEKEVLLKEIHHRVKNNLQIILSLLSLDVRFHPDDLNMVIDNVKSRVHSIALIHNKIYNSPNLTSVDIGEYLEDIINYISELKPKDVHFVLNCQKIEGTLQLCIPLGLILIEIVNNSLKYAFDDDKGHIYIDLFKEDSHNVLRIYDDGKGIPKNVDIFNSNSLGLMVVNDLIRQIDGTLEAYECDGAGFKITFES